MKKTVKTVKAVVKQIAQAAKPVVSLFYKLLRGTPFYAPNLRKSDFVAQVFESGKLPKNPKMVLVQGAHGICVSVCNIHNNMLDLMDGRLFDLSGIKRHAVMKLGSSARSFAKEHGHLHTVQLKAGPKKGTHTGYILGKFEDPYVGFVAKDGSWAWGLDTFTLPEGRNEERVFSLVK